MFCPLSVSCEQSPSCVCTLKRRHGGGCVCRHGELQLNGTTTSAVAEAGRRKARRGRAR